LLLVAFLLVNAPNCHVSLVLASVVQDDAVNCNSRDTGERGHFGPFTIFLEICMQIHSVVFAVCRQINKQKVCENN